MGEVLEPLVCLDPKDIKEFKDLLVFLGKWDDPALLENLVLKEKLVNKVSKESLDDRVLPDQKVYLDLSDLLVLQEMMDHKDHLDFQVNEVDKESKDTRVTQEQLDLKDQQVLLDLLVYLENLDVRVNQELLVNVDLLVYQGKMDNVV